MFWDFPGGGYCCPECGEPFTPLGDHVSGEQLDWQVIVQGLNVLTWLTAYLNERGRNGGQPLTGPALERFLPWNASPEEPPHLGTADTRRINPAPITLAPAPSRRRATPSPSMPFHRTFEYLFGLPNTLFFTLNWMSR